MRKGREFLKVKFEDNYWEEWEAGWEQSAGQNEDLHRGLGAAEVSKAQLEWCQPFLNLFIVKYNT